MLIEFAVENFKSFKELQVLSLEARPDGKRARPDHRVVELEKGCRLVKTKAIYGANASGKSNLTIAFAAMWKIVMYSLNADYILEQHISPYKFEGFTDKPSYFQIIFIENGKRYRYGFEADKDKIHSEWLYVKNTREVVLFEREFQELTELNEQSFAEGKILKKGIKMFTSKTLVISVLDQLKEPVSSTVKECIVNKIIISPQLTQADKGWRRLTMRFLETDEYFLKWTKEMLNTIDNSIIDFRVLKEKSVDGSEVKIPTIYRKDKNENVAFLLLSEEASGTKKIFDFARIIFQCIKQGHLFVIDEWDALLHPKLTRKIIELFHSEESHPNAQMIFVTHDTNLLDSYLLRKDQIAFVEKSRSGDSEVYNLSDIKGVRPNDLFEKNYLKGNYGALPILNNFF